MYQPEHALHLSVEQLAAHLERRLRGSERELVVAHLVECVECRREYIDAGAVLGRSNARWFGVTTPMGIRAVELVAAAVLIFAFVPRTYAPLDPGVTGDAATQRIAVTDAALPIQLVSPADGDRLTGPTIVLAWRSDGPRALYRVTVQTADGTVVWKKNTSDTTVTLPPVVELTAGATYYWIVDALHADGRTARSAANEFRR